jgi:hypothetical protein
MRPAVKEGWVFRATRLAAELLFRRTVQYTPRQYTNISRTRERVVRMKSLPTTLHVLAILLVLPVLSEAQTAVQPVASPFSLALTPDFSVPLGSDSELFAVGGGATLSAEYRMPFLPLLFAGAGIGYSYVPLKSVTTLSLLDGDIRAGVRYDIIQNLSVRAFAAP